MKKFVTYILILLPGFAFGQLFPEVDYFKGNIEKITEKKYGKEAYVSKKDSDVFKPKAFSGWRYIYQFDENSKLVKRTNYNKSEVVADYSYQREQIENRKIEREIILKNPEGQEGDYTEYENFFNAEGRIEKVNFWAFTAKKNTRELFLVEMDAKYDNGRLLSFMRHNVKEDGSFDSGEKCELFYDFSGQLIRLERKNIELNLKTIIYYSHNSKGFINSYSIDYLVGLRNGQNNQKQDIYFNCDRYGNWVRKYLIYDNKKHLEAKRIIKYYYDGFMSWQKKKE